MKYLTILIAILPLWLCLPASPAQAIGETFQIEISGTEYCGDFDSTRFNSQNNVDLWVRIDSLTQITVSFTPNFAGGTTFVMSGQTYLNSAKRAAFIGGVDFGGGSYAVLQGLANFDRDGNVSRISGFFIQNEVLFLGLFFIR